jgi:hypothetical protein
MKLVGGHPRYVKLRELYLIATEEVGLYNSIG